MVATKNKVLCFLLKNPFSTYFLPKTPKKHPRYLVKPIHGHENIKNRPETKNLPKIKKKKTLPEFRYGF
jgi:hypothetical protein